MKVDCTYGNKRPLNAKRIVEVFIASECVGGSTGLSYRKRVLASTRQAVRDRLLFRNLEDRGFQTAALSASSGEAVRLFARTVERGMDKVETTLFRQAAAVIGARQKSGEVQSVLQQVVRAAESWRAASLEGLGRE